MSDIVGRIWESLGGLSGSRPAAKFNNDEVALIKAVDGLLEQRDRLRSQVAEQEATIRRLQDRASKDAETFLERVREAVSVRMASSLRDPAAVLINHLRGLINVDSVLEYYRAREAEATSSPTPPNTQPACANGGESKPEDAR